MCEECWLVQLEEYESAENIFSDYAYFASYSDSWLKHCEKYCTEMTSAVRPGRAKFCSGGRQQRWLSAAVLRAQAVPVLGIEPAANVAKAAIEKASRLLVRFFGVQVAKDARRRRRTADLVIGNNVLAQVPDLNDFVEGLQNSC